TSGLPRHRIACGVDGRGDEYRNALRWCGPAAASSRATERRNDAFGVTTGAERGKAGPDPGQRDEHRHPKHHKGDLVLEGEEGHGAQAADERTAYRSNASHDQE